ncbi:UPF0182 family protein [Miltoncostaea marina]|uniref:UPF0182 family protein n=1 Tax=Miltoncostaea marina TaxID=2843215 RepID=UPI001C3DDE4F|nr:UPF0182 family protein [Miltoncostaea marina]
MALLLAYLALRLWARITLSAAFFDSLGMGGAYSTALRASFLLAGAGLAGALALALPIGLVTGRRAGMLRQRRVGWTAGAATFVVSALVLVPALLSRRDAILAAGEAVAFGGEGDPVFGRDPSFYVFTLPVVVDLSGLALGGLVVALLGIAGVAIYAAVVDHPLGVRRRLIERAGALAAVYGGLALVALAVLTWFRRYETLHGGGELIAGPGRAMRDVGIPTATVVSGVILAAGLGVAALAVPQARRRLAGARTIAVARTALAVLGLVVLALAVLATPWWLVLLLALAPLAAELRPGGRLARAIADQASAALRANQAPFRLPAWTLGAAAGAVAVLSLALAPAATALYDAVALRGSTLQVERENIAATLDSTRAAAGIDEVEATAAEYRRGGVSRAAIEAAPASVGSLRFLDLEAGLAACRRLQALNRYYTCHDADLDRYVRDGRPQTLFVFGREVDYAAITDFQRRHFSFTHGRGVAMAPVNRIDDSGRPAFVVGGLPTRGLDPPLERPEIYHGAQRGMPFAIVNTDQPDGFTNAPAERWEGAGVDVEDHRLALTLELGGLPFVGGGRQLWNALSRVDTAEAQLLMHRDLPARLGRLAPFLRLDADPYFVAEGGRLWVMQNAYTRTDRYPYGAHFGGASYQRHAITAVMDAYSGETALYVMDDEDPLIATWRRVYPELFSDAAAMPDGIAAHLRYGEDQFDFQAAALQRFHVTDTERFFSNDDAWAPTVETTGRGTEGRRITSPARYSYAVLPGESEERFLALRYFKPATEGRGIAFSAWLTAESAPERFGRLRLLRFDVAEDALDSVDTFVASVARDAELSAQIGLRRDQVLRGNTIVVPIGEGLLYVQPLYLDTSADSLPTLWQVVVSLGDGQIHSASTFLEALDLALAAQGDDPGAPAGDGGGGAAGGSDGTPGGAPAGAIDDLVRDAAAAYEAYRRAWAAGDYVAAARHLRRFERLLQGANQAAQAG